jgi:UDP-glucose 4-epimerase
MRIAITGGRGFIGAHVERWAREYGHAVSFFDKREGNDIMGDLSALRGADAVIHLAGVLGTLEMFDDIETAVRINVLGSTRVAQWCLDNDAQYVGILVPDVFPSVYCATKAGAKRVTDVMHSQLGLRVAHVTAFNAHGPGQAFGPGHPRKFGPTFSMAAWQNQPIPIWGDGTALVDPIRASDVGRMLVEAASPHNDDNIVFDGGTGLAVTVNEIARHVNKITGNLADPGVAYEPMRVGEDPKGNVAAVGLGWERLDWRPDTDWQSALEETVLWYRDHARAGRTEITSGL